MLRWAVRIDTACYRRGRAHRNAWHFIGCGSRSRLRRLGSFGSRSAMPHPCVLGQATVIGWRGRRCHLHRWHCVGRGWRRTRWFGNAVPHFRVFRRACACRRRRRRLLSDWLCRRRLGFGGLASGRHRAMIHALHRLCRSGDGCRAKHHAGEQQFGSAHAPTPRGRTLTTRIIPACM